MAAVFKFHVQEGYEWVLAERREDRKMFRSLGADRVAAEWTPVWVVLLREDGGQTFRRSDAPWLSSDAPVFREGAKAVVERAVAGDAEFLPLACKTANFSLMHVTRIIDALDLDHSEIEWLAPGERILRIRRHVFRPDWLRGVAAFKIPQYMNGAVFVSESVVDAVRTANLEGIGFQEVWRDTL